MKKLLLSSLFILLMNTIAMAREVIPFSVNYDENKPIGHGTGKAPIQPPTVYIEDYTLTFVANHPDYILTIKDDDGDVVFTTMVFSTETQIALPSTLTGEYEIELRMGYWKFTGYINL